MAIRFSFVLLLALASQSQGAEPPTMLFQGAAVHDSGAAGGARTAFAIMRLPDGSFAFYDRYAPEKGPLSLPDAGEAIAPRRATWLDRPADVGWRHLARSD